MQAVDEALAGHLGLLCRAGQESARLQDGRLVVAVAGAGEGDLDDQLGAIFERLRRASSRERLRDQGLDVGFRIEDLLALTIQLPGDGADFARRWLRRRVPGEVVLNVAPEPGPLFLAAAFAGRVGHAPARERYLLGGDGRMRVEAFELHVVEHCNLRCANCCNMSPLVAKRTMTVGEVEGLCRRMAAVLNVDVFKIMGGEPLMHPEIVGVLGAIRRSGISGKIRLFTNGLLLASMKPEFWSSLDELTISSYSSAPVKPALLARARAQAKAHGFVLNVKEVAAFSQVLSPAYRPQVQQTFERCWLRHRCIIVRHDRFFMCTRAAYAEDFLERASCEPVPSGAVLDREGDGVPLDTADLPARLVEYMNRTGPLAACHYCLGGDGALEPHHQLSKADVAAGRLSSLKVHVP
jgi:hypothetical protein